MSKYAYAYALQERPFEELPAKPRRKRSFSIPLIELLRPDGYWPQPLSIEQAFELMRWMVDTGDPQYETRLRWGCAGVAELLNGASTVSAHNLHPIISIEDLRKRFHYAVLARPQSDGQHRWRKDFGITPSGIVTIERRTYRPFDGAAHLGWRSEADIQESLTALLTGSTGKRMAVSLNSTHKRCNWLHHVRVAIYRDHGFSFLLTFGENPKTPGASRWTDVIARSRPGESFLDTKARARDVFDCLVNGKATNADTADLFEHRYIGEKFIRRQIDRISASAAGKAAA